MNWTRDSLAEELSQMDFGWFFLDVTTSPLVFVKNEYIAKTV